MDPQYLYSPSGDFASRRPEIALTTAEIHDFFNEVNTTDHDYIFVEELQARLVKTYAQLLGTTNTTSAAENEGDGLRTFLQDLVPNGKNILTREEFIRVVRNWNVPSQQQTNTDIETELHASDYKLPWHRRLESYWNVRGSKVSFVAFVVALQLACGFYYLITYALNQRAHAAMGNGLVFAKFCAGLLYPTIFFLLLSMSRWAMTLLRRYLPFAHFINWDRSRSFHIYIGISATVFGTLHGIGHMAGSYVSASNPANRVNVDIAFGAPPTAPVPNYGYFMTMLPSWTGIISLALFYIIGALAHPRVRRWNYEVFQYSHLLMFPLMALLIAHGTLALLQKPALIWWVMVPLILIVWERFSRFAKAFFPVVGNLTVLDKDAVMLSVKSPKDKMWGYQAGQFVFLNVPSLSKFQWHPFTVSACEGCMLQLTIKTDGNWTKRLRQLPHVVKIAVDGPYGAPSQRFYEFDRSIVIGAGVGITPFSAILTDLEQKLSKQLDPWAKKAFLSSLSRSATLSSKLSRATSFSSSSSSSSSLCRSYKGKSYEDNSAYSRPKQAFSELAGADKARKSVLLRPRSPPNIYNKPLPPVPGSATKPNVSPTLSSASWATVDTMDTSSDVKSITIQEPLGETSKSSLNRSNTTATAKVASAQGPSSKNRVDFHWLVRDTSTIGWFSSLLNRAHDLSLAIPPELLKLNITAHITSAGPSAKTKDGQNRDQKSVSKHIFRYLLDSYRTESSPVSLLSGLKARSSFGRPDFRLILEQYDREVRAELSQAEYMNRSGKEANFVSQASPLERRPNRWAVRDKRIGVFFCGAPVIAETLKRECARLNRRAAERGDRVVWVFMEEIFG